jgi:hypothetical protein
MFALDHTRPLRTLSDRNPIRCGDSDIWILSYSRPTALEKESKKPTIIQMLPSRFRGEWTPGTRQPKPRRQRATDARVREHREPLSDLEQSEHLMDPSRFPRVDDQAVLKTPIKRTGRQFQHGAVDVLSGAIGPSVDHQPAGIGSSGVGAQKTEPGRIESGLELATAA